MIESYRRALAELLDYSTFAYQTSGADRSKLHNIEMEAGDDAPWVWADVELLADSVAGIAVSCLKERWRTDMTKEEAIEFLQSQSIFDVEHLVDWIGTEGASYPDFMRSMLANEGVRLATICCLQRSL